MSDNSQNSWFGISMFLIGLIAGAAIMGGMSGGFAPTNQGAGSNQQPNVPTAPTNQVTAQEKMEKIAKGLNVDLAAFRACLESDKHLEGITAEMNTGREQGVNGTPGNIIVNLKTKKAQLLSGAQPYENFKKAIDEMIANPRPPNPPGTTEPTSIPSVDTANEHIRGNPKADIAIIEYSDFQCPFCTRVHPTYQKIIAEYGDKVMWVFRHFPLDSIHPDAIPLAEGSECIAELAGKDAFWTYTDALFES